MAISIAGLCLTACSKNLSATASAPPPDASGRATCVVSRAQPFIGKPADTVAEDARVAAGARNVRVIRPGTAVTMDYRGDRLNLKTDDAGIVTSVSCG